MHKHSSPARDLAELRRRIARLEGRSRSGRGEAVSSGCEALDHLLPEGGFRRGTLIEWLSAEAAGAATLALIAAQRVCQQGGKLVVLDPRREFCPPAAVRLGIRSEQLLVVHAETTRDNHWAIDQALRSSAVAAVLAWPRKIDDRTFRRWQLAAESGGTLGLLLRPETARSEASWSDVRLAVESLPLAGYAWLHPTPGNSNRFLRIRLLRCGGSTQGRSLEVELDDETHRLCRLEKQRRQLAR